MELQQLKNEFYRVEYHPGSSWVTLNQSNSNGVRSSLSSDYILMKFCINWLKNELSMNVSATDDMVVQKNGYYDIYFI